MAHFYGTVQGHKGEASRTGHVDLYVTAQSSQGSITVHLCKLGDVDEVWIAVRKHGEREETLLYRGSIADLLSMEARAAQMHLLGVQKFLEGCQPRED